jgi:GT2 family glycosyltransferase
MRFSVLIVTFNNESTIGNCLESLRRQSQRDFEILVRDNGSSDATVRIIEDFGKAKLSKSSRNEGFGAGMNKLAGEAGGEYLFLLNPDCVCPEHTLQKLHDFAVSHEGAIAPALIGLDGRQQISARNLPDFKNIVFSRRSPLYLLRLINHEAAGYLEIHQPTKVPAVSATALAIKRQLYDGMGGFDERFFMYLEDIDLCHRLGDAGVDIWYLPDLKIQHIWGASSKKYPFRSSYHHYVSMFKYFAKHHQKDHFRLFILLFLLASGFVSTSVLSLLGFRGRR